ncbi:MAG: pilin protein MshA, partial [Proteobacteria bacterium]|nr:pilin protein MshA [Pseudomonadota bacterium]
MHILAYCSLREPAVADPAVALSDSSRTTSRFSWLLLSLCMSCLPALGHAQQPPSPDNNTCGSAQAIDGSSLPVTVDGTLDSIVSPDLDFFKVTGLTAGSLVMVDLKGSVTGDGTLEDPFLGSFDSTCNPLSVNDDWGSLNSRLYVTVPENGELVLAATKCCDADFVGGGNGTYRLAISQAETIGSISGRVVDAVIGRPISGSSPLFGSASLVFCDDLSCQFQNSTSLDDQGRFSFNTDASGNRLPAGNYIISSFADQYQGGTTDLGTVNAGEDRDAGVIRLQPNPVQFSEVVPCQNLPASGGRCEYAVNIRNTQRNAFKGLAWSNVFAFGTGSFLGGTYFTADKEAIYLAAAGRSGSLQNFTFRFNVPAKVADFATFCTEVWVGKAGKNPFFDTQGAFGL